MTSREFGAKLERRIARTGLMMPSPQAMALLEAYYSILARWNARINLTSLPLAEGASATLDRLLIEPLAAARYVSESPIRWVDLGSGGGSPAIPLKIVRPTARLTLVEATTKKATFLREVIRELQLLDVDVENLRIEELEARTQLKGTVQLATARALRMNSALFGAVRSLLEPGGRLHLYATRSPDISSSSGFAVEAVHKLATGLETRLVVLKLLEHSVAASPMVLEAPLQEGSASHVSRGTSPLRINGRPPSRRKKR